MESDVYKGYLIYGHSINEGEVFAASGTVMKDGHLVATTGVLDFFDTDKEASDAGIAWARDWIDKHE